MLVEHQRTVIAPAMMVGRSAARCPMRQAASLDIVIRVRMPAKLFRARDPSAALQVSQVTRTALAISIVNANTIAPAMRPTLLFRSANGKVSRWSSWFGGGWLQDDVLDSGGPDPRPVLVQIVAVGTATPNTLTR